MNKRQGILSDALMILLNNKIFSEVGEITKCKTKDQMVDIKFSNSNHVDIEETF